MGLNSRENVLRPPTRSLVRRRRSPLFMSASLVHSIPVVNFLFLFPFLGEIRVQPAKLGVLSIWI